MDHTESGSAGNPAKSPLMYPQLAAMPTIPPTDSAAPKMNPTSLFVARAPSPKFVATAGSVLALVLTLFSAFESSPSIEDGLLWAHFGARLAIDYTSLITVVLVVAAAHLLVPPHLFLEGSSKRAILFSLGPYSLAGVVGGVARYHLRLWLGLNWHIEYPLELWTNVGAGILTFTLIGFLASQYYPLMQRFERLRALCAITEEAADIAFRRSFNRRVGMADRPDEVGHLSRTVNYLLATVESTLESHRDFLADTSHELRNPLQAIRVNLELAERIDNSSEREECIRECIDEVERMSRLVEDLLTLARLEARQIIERRPVALQSLLQDVVRGAKRRACGQQILVQHVEKVEVLGDEGRLRQVLDNLMRNALRHTPPNGMIHLSLQAANGWAMLEISDTGEGIAPQHLPHIFERFYQVGKTRDGGAGLGLAIVKHLCEAHGGHVTAASEPGKGSRFTVCLPLSSPSPH